MNLNLEVLHRCPETEARATRFHTTRGPIDTPQFMPVGTQGAVKTLTAAEVRELGASVILGNTYHLGVRPGVPTLRALGGMHRMYGWEGSILTDSGGFQVLSLADLRKIDDEGVEFRNHIDGAKLKLTPEKSLEIQGAIGSDLMMVLDHLPPTTAPRAEVEAAMRRTTQWALRSLAARDRGEVVDPDRQALLAIIQGGTDHALRKRHVEALCAHPFDGFAVGGLSVGESIPEMYDTLEATAPLLPPDKPRYLMGVGTPVDLVEGVARGVDLFDCVMPTRNARKGYLFVDRGRRRLNLKNARFKHSTAPLDETCPCPICAQYSAGYLRHLLMVGEFLVHRLLTIHNLSIYLRLMADIRRALAEGRFAEFRAEWRSGLPT